MCRDGGQRLLNKSAFSAAPDMLTAVERHQSERCVPCCCRSEKVRHLRLRDPSLPLSLPQQAAGTLLRTFNLLLFPKMFLRCRIFPPGKLDANASRRLASSRSAAIIKEARLSPLLVSSQGSELQQPGGVSQSGAGPAQAEGAVSTQTLFFFKAQIYAL